MKNKQQPVTNQLSLEFESEPAYLSNTSGESEKSVAVKNVFCFQEKKREEVKEFRERIRRDLLSNRVILG